MQGFIVIIHAFFSMEFETAYFEGKKDGCAPSIESCVAAVRHRHDRDLPTTQTASLIAASFRT
jgi:hypothetical protein